MLGAGDQEVIRRRHELVLPEHHPPVSPAPLNATAQDGERLGGEVLDLLFRGRELLRGSERPHRRCVRHMMNREPSPEVDLEIGELRHGVDCGLNPLHAVEIHLPAVRQGYARARSHDDLIEGQIQR